MISDLPLPVSPVRRFRPGPNRTVASATSARSRTLSSFSNLLLRHQGPAPAELLAKPLVEGLGWTEADDLEAPLVGAAADYVAGVDGDPLPGAVNSQLCRTSHDLQRHVLARREHDRPYRERERAHRHEHEVVQR